MLKLLKLAVCVLVLAGACAGGACAGAGPGLAVAGTVLAPKAPEGAGTKGGE